MSIQKPLKATLTLSREEVEDLIKEALAQRGMSPSGPLRAQVRESRDAFDRGSEMVFDGYLVDIAVVPAKP